MKQLLSKLSEHLLSIGITVLVVAIGFYYTTKFDIVALKRDNNAHTVQIETLDKRLNEKDVQFERIITQQDYIIKMLEEVRKDIKDK